METAMSELESRMQEIGEEIRKKQEEMNALKRQYRQEITEDYTLLNGKGEKVRLGDLFGDKEDLILVHNMGARCVYCTLWADGFIGLYPHLADRASFVVVSPDAPEKQTAFAASRSWPFPMYSDQQMKFSRDMGFLTTHEGSDYWLPGTSTFHRDTDGRVTRTAKDFFGPGDSYCGLWHLFDLLDAPEKQWQPNYSY
jgi:predicted dithiol-disulfide oxidoreductase (DUF899 family)